MEYNLQDLIDIEHFQQLQDRLNKIYSFPSAIIDNEGNILTATAWQDICTKFHRVNKECAAECTKSDQYILRHLHEANPAVSYRCPHGLIDSATPIIIEGMHYGNFFTGQLFLKEPEMDFFKAQAKRYGFDEAAYLEAVKKVPVWTLEQLDNYLFFIKGLIEVISSIGLKNLKEIEASKLIKEKEEQARTILSQMFDGYWVLDMRGNILDVNDALCRMVGYSRDELIGMSIEDIAVDDSPEVIASRIRSIVRDGDSYFQTKFQRKDKAIIIADVAVRYLPDRQQMIGFHRDITDKKKAEEALRENEARLNTILDNVGAYIFIKDTQYRYTYANNKVCELFGRKLEDITGHSDADFFSAESVEEILQTDRAVIERGVTASREEKDLTAADNVPRTYWTVKLPMFDSQGNVSSLCGISADITSHKETEKKIRESEAYIRNILDTVDEGFTVVDRDYRVMAANKAYCAQVGLSIDEMVGRYCYEVSCNSEHPCFEIGEECPVREVFATGHPQMALHKHINKDGNVLFVETKAFPNRDEAGNIVSAIKVVHNVTERHLLEAEQLKTQKLEAVGMLAGGIAHDFNNLLQVLFGNISMAQLYKDEPAKVAELLSQAEKALSMSVNLTAQLLTFAKGGKPVIKKMDLRPVIENTVKFTLSGSRCDCRLIIPQELWNAEADEGQIGQVIQNIVLNADEAMPAGGTVDILAENVEIPSGSNMHLPNGGKFIKIVIKDTGVGIPEKHLQKIFDPYFTTKQKGSGLGLATSYSIVRNHRGAIEVKSNPESGTIFSIYLPAIEAEKEKPAPAPGISTTRKCRILVMDDEEIVLDVAKKMVTAFGHDVEQATEGAIVIEKYRQALASEKPFDLVILDLTIKGGMGGAETVKRLLEMDPNVKAVVASGYSDNPILSNFKDYGFSAVLGKPYSLAALKDCLNALVDRSPIS
jgi:PAS domain S-box-containing protein